MIKNTEGEIHVRGLSKDEVEVLNLKSKEMNFKSNNEFFLFIIRQFIEQQGKKNSNELFLREIANSNNLLLKNLKARSENLNKIEKRIKKNSEAIVKIVDKI